jgi:D-alanyl-D-alanine carboxypeptidase (penicillin-binding protein 5/6)
MGHFRGFIFFFSFLEVLLFSKNLEVQIETPYAVLVNAKTGKVLFDKRGSESVYPGSTTKIVSVLYILKHAGERLDDVVICSEEALRVVSEEVKAEKMGLLPPYILELDGTTYNLRRKEKISLRELLHGALIASGNDASNVAAEHVSGNIDAFVKNMNEMIQSMGCKNTHFCNPHGLFHPDHKTTPYEMTVLAREALKYPLFREIVKMPGYKRSKMNGNHLIRPDSKNFYPFAIGIKTGYTKKAKYNLIAAADNGERELVVALHKSPTSNQRFLDAIALFEAAFNEKKVQRVMFAKDETSFKKEIQGAKVPLEAIMKEDFVFKYFPSEEEEMVASLEWEDLILPIEKDSSVAVLSLFTKEDGRFLAKQELFAKNSVHKKLSAILLEQFSKYWAYLILLIVLVIGYLFVRREKVQ